MPTITKPTSAPSAERTSAYAQRSAPDTPVSLELKAASPAKIRA